MRAPGGRKVDTKEVRNIGVRSEDFKICHNHLKLQNNAQ